MPKRAVRIFVATVLMGFLGAAGAAQQTHDTSKTQATPPPPTPVRATATTAATTVKFGPITRDVCDKHPNLKQCS